ncbi:MDR family oxidoreductase [Allopusillimonas ginsengisoli]|uniref:acrylyl-CoA reductase (NADPH) n=1 Tax=Allopusillimonas ginsengisoli TaxID=453575 RepID=UPI001020B068|nr:MDR family oxidoreductase [Allopusillimonas ginsengisoli]TEA74191.1 oxidoreductase [Allopusillimonas ginsengisoli]
MHQALWLDKDEKGTKASFRDLDDALLGEGEVVVAVEWSTLNYKDALAILGRSSVVRKFPMIPGIDLAGTVESSDHPDFLPGQRVVLNGWGHGESLFGGLTSKVRVPAAHLISLPDAVSTRTAMAIGTAGYTAMLCVLALERHGVEAKQGEILVTGASGGVGGFATALLARSEYQVVASTGRMTEEARLRRLGAVRVEHRDEIAKPGKPLQKERWAGAIDSVGSHTLANVCAQIRYRGTVAACGLAQGMDFPTTVAPFILRGVTLAGIDSVKAPHSERLAAWSRLASDLSLDIIEDMVNEISLSSVVDGARELLEGRVAGRLLVRIG